MIHQSCPVLVLDDERDELWQVSHGLALCGLPVMSHHVRGGQLEYVPEIPHAGVRLLFTDLHLLGSTQSKPEQYVAALISFIKKLVQPTTYVVVFWSNYEEEAAEAWNLLRQRAPAALQPFAYRSLPKELAKRACDNDEDIAKEARAALRKRVEEVLDEFPQLQAMMNWETSVSQAAATTTNQLVRVLAKGNAPVGKSENVRAVFARMAQEAVGYPYAAAASTRGLLQALNPILLDCLERSGVPAHEHLARFLAISDDKQISLPDKSLVPFLNDFFIHAEGDVKDALDRGAVVRFSEEYLKSPEGLSRDIGLTDGKPGEWQEAVCREFHKTWRSASTTEAGSKAKNALLPTSVYGIELSAVCDHAQDKQRSQRFLFALFVPTASSGDFLDKNNRPANDAIYVTPEITVDNVTGRFLISCRVFIARPHRETVPGKPISRLRKDVVDELSHLYSTHLRRPGKIAFW